jgi:hypothetical protein
MSSAEIRLQLIQRCIELLWYGGDLCAEGIQALFQRIDALAERLECRR